MNNKKDDKNAAFYVGNSSKGSKKGHGGSKKILNASIARSEGMSGLTAGLRVVERMVKGLKEKARINLQEMKQILQRMKMESGWLPSKI